MRKLFWVSILIALAVAVALLLWSQSKQPVTTSKVLEGAVGASNLTPNHVNANRDGTNSLPPISQISSNPLVADETRRQKVYNEFVAEHNVPINCYGQILDQFSNAVPGASVKIGIRHLTIPDPLIPQVGSKQVYLESVSDAEGRFEFHGETGDGFGIGITKEGYILSPNAPTGFGPDAGTSDNPVIFTMWKKGNSQHLITHYLSRISTPIDGRVIQFDLLNGTEVSSDGQLIVRVNRDPQVLPPGNDGYDWSAELDIPNGGLLATNDGFMFRAPKSGYSEVYKVDMPKGSTNWTTTLDQQFYIHLPNGDYGSLAVHLPTFHSPPPIVLTLGITVNPNGSGDLQP